MIVVHKQRRLGGVNARILPRHSPHLRVTGPGRATPTQTPTTGNKMATNRHRKSAAVSTRDHRGSGDLAAAVADGDGKVGLLAIRCSTCCHVDATC